jgi:hypothetical protein
VRSSTGLMDALCTSLLIHVAASPPFAGAC